MEFLEIAKVKCMGRHHRIGLTSKGRLSLLDHQGENEDALSALLVFNPDERCRCREVKLLWNWYRQTSEYRGPDWYQIREDHPWVEQAFSAKRGYFEAPTPSQLLGQLPVPLRPYAQEASQKNQDRRHKTWRESVVEGRFLQMSKGHAQNRLKVLRQRKIARIIGINSCIDAIPIPTEVFVFENTPWFKAIKDCGLFPCALPPVDLWQRSYPQFVKAYRKVAPTMGGHRHGRHRWNEHDEVWVRIQFLLGSDEYPSQYTVISKGQ